MIISFPCSLRWRKERISTFLRHDGILVQSHFLSDAFFDIAVSFEKYLIFITFSQQTAGRKYTENLLLRTVLNHNSYSLRSVRFTDRSNV
ncbi:MAG: hypothetical protein LBR79_00015 [Oscillospiraceae bacterium]|nr:hypothetical protein [Oscillospiraceae bacterium]